MRAAEYIRVSHEEQVIHGLSIEAQTSALNEWANANKVQVVGQYVDAGLSARKPAYKRPELQRLLLDVEAGRIDIIVFTKLDRWFRNVAEYHKVQEILEKHNVTWRAIHEDYETETSSGRLKVNIMLAVAQDEADRTSERIKAVFHRKKQKGEPCSGAVPIGFVMENKRIVIDKENAPVVREIFSHYIATRSAYATQRYLSAKYGIQYHTTTIRKILQNQRYIGIDNGVDGACEPIIDAQTFALAQEILSVRAQRIHNSPNPRIYLFSGIVTCGECGHSLTSVFSKGHHYYRCARHTAVGDCDFNKYVREATIEEYLIANILKECAEHNANITAASRNRPLIDEVGIKRKMAKLKDLYLSDLIEKAEYERDYLALRAALDDAQALPKPQPALIDIEAMRVMIKAYEGLTRMEKKEFWSRVLVGVSVTKDAGVSFTLRNI